MASNQNLSTRSSLDRSASSSLVSSSLVSNTTSSESEEFTDQTTTTPPTVSTSEKEDLRGQTLAQTLAEDKANKPQKTKISVDPRPKQAPQLTRRDSSSSSSSNDNVKRNKHSTPQPHSTTTTANSSTSATTVQIQTRQGISMDNMQAKLEAIKRYKSLPTKLSNSSTPEELGTLLLFILGLPSKTLQKANCSQQDLLDITTYLIHAKANLDVVDENNKTALLTAVVKDHSEIVRVLLEKGVISLEKIDEAFLLAAKMGRLKTVHILRIHGANLETTNEKGYTALIYAASNHYPEVFQALLDYGATLDPKSYNSKVIFLSAVFNNYVDVVRILVGKDIRLNYLDEGLLIAANNGYTKIVQILLDYGADFKVKDKNGATAFDLASMGNHDEVCDIFRIEDFITFDNPTTTATISTATIALSSSQNEQDRSFDIVREKLKALKFRRKLSNNSPSKVLSAALCFFASCSPEELKAAKCTKKDVSTIVQWLVHAGADPNTAAKFGIPALMHFADWGHFDAVQILLDHGADADANNLLHRHKATLRDFSAKSNKHNSILKAKRQKHIAKKASPQETTIKTPIPLPSSQHAQAMSVDEVRTKLEALGSPRSLPNNPSFELLNAALLFVVACSSSKLQEAQCSAMDVAAMVQWFLTAGADLEIEDKNRNTVTLLATKNGHTEAVKILTKKGANLEAKDKNNATALLHAAMNNNTELIKFLIKNDANVNQAEENGYTALIHVISHGNLEAIRFLIESGANVQVQFKGFQTQIDLLLPTSNKNVKQKSPVSGRVEMRRGGVRLSISVSVPFV